MQVEKKAKNHLQLNQRTLVMRGELTFSKADTSQKHIQSYISQKTLIWAWDYSPANMLNIKKISEKNVLHLTDLHFEAQGIF